MSNYLSAILAGVFIGIGGASCTLCGNQYIGALLFCVGLYPICAAKLNLFTGKVGFVQDSTDVLSLPIILLGNWMGALLCAIFVLLARPEIAPLVATTVEARMGQPLVQTLSMAILCGVLVHIAVWLVRNKNQYLGIFICIPAFILCGFEHCVADMFTFAISGEAISVSANLHILLVAAGNSLGALATQQVLKKIS